jgi:serine/threonine-protein kinase
MLKDPELDVRLIPGYELLRPIGRGGMGVAYLARQLSLGRQVVIKILNPAPDVDPAEQAARFRREAEMMAQISHPNVTTIFDFGIDEGRPYLVMEYVEGGDLRKQMVAGNPLPIDRVRDLLRSLVRALEFVHNHGILHRDLKPENILMDREDTPKVTDFGIAVPEAARGDITRSGYAMGTIGYIAPEQQYRLPVDERADQYSLAALSYEMLTGQLPLGAFPPPSRLNRKLHPSVDAVILRALSEDRTDRYDTLGAFGDALDRALAVPHRRRLLAVVSSALVLLGAAGLTTLESLRNRPPLAPRPGAGAGAGSRC